MFMQVLNANNAIAADSHEVNPARLRPGKGTTSTTMETSTDWTEIENDCEDVDIKYEPLDPYVENHVSFFANIFFSFKFYFLRV